MPPSHDTQSRQTFLSILLAGMALMFFVFMLILITGGFFIWVVAVVAGLVALTSFHYFLWGRAFSQQVAGEVEEEQLRQRAAEGLDGQDWNYPDQTGSRR
jgi:fatty acid desaturase